VNEERALRYAQVLIEQYGHEVEFEVDLPSENVPQVIHALTQLGCKVETHDDRPARITVICKS
jgi:hypothetical protein